MSELLLSKWDLQSQTNWRMYAADGFNILAADVASLAAEEKARVEEVHPDLKEEHHQVDEIFNEDTQQYDYGPKTHRRVERYNDETGRYEYVQVPIEPERDFNMLYMSWNYYVNSIPEDGYRLYEWIYRELKKRRMPWAYPEQPTTADRNADQELQARAEENGWDYVPRQYGDRRRTLTLPVALHPDLTAMIPQTEESEEEDALALADAQHTPRNQARNLPRHDLATGLQNQRPDGTFSMAMAHNQTVQYLIGFTQALRWLAEKNRPFPDYKSKSFTFLIMVRWLQSFDMSVNDTEIAGPEYTNTDRVMHTLSNGWRIEIRDNARDCEVEGEHMGHCVGGYGNMVEEGRTAIFSLVDKRGYPHATMQFEQESGGRELPYPGAVQQIRGKQNVAPVPGYVELIKEWINSVPHRVYWVEGYCEDRTLTAQAGNKFLFSESIDSLGSLKRIASDLRSNPELLQTTIINKDVGPDEYGFFLSAKSLPGVITIDWSYLGDGLSSALNSLLAGNTPTAPYQQQPQEVNQENIRDFLQGVFDDLYLVTAVGHRNFQAMLAAGVSHRNFSDPFPAGDDVKQRLLYYLRDEPRTYVNAYFDRYFGKGVETLPETSFQPQLFEARWRPRWHRPASHWQRPLRGFFSSARM